MNEQRPDNELVRQPEVLGPAQLLEQYPLLVAKVMEETMALFDANMAGQSLEILNMPRIKVPPGGAPTFIVETAEGDTAMAKIEGVNIAARQARVYFNKPYGTGGNRLPSCTSKDGFTGIGDPGGSCKKCPFAQFGTAIRPDGSKGAGQACKQVSEILFLLPGENLPHLLRVPPTSLKGYTQFLMNLISAGVRHWSATTILTLEPAQNEGGIKYSRIRFRLGKRFPPALVKVLEPYRLRMRELLIPSVVDATAYEVDDEPAVMAEPPSAADELRKVQGIVESEEQGQNPDQIPF